MTPKEKAEQLFYYYYNELKEHKDIYYIKTSKQCALIAVDEILNAHLFDLDEKQYWQQVRTEIENL